jgi:succinate dehydrogenase/fumarate reductase flavoprotein subunit
MIVLANLMQTAALMREESRGCHYRTDFPGQAEYWRRHIVFRRGGDEITHELRPVGALTDFGYDWPTGSPGEA